MELLHKIMDDLLRVHYDLIVYLAMFFISLALLHRLGESPTEIFFALIKEIIALMKSPREISRNNVDALITLSTGLLTIATFLFFIVGGELPHSLEFLKEGVKGEGQSSALLFFMLSVFVGGGLMSLWITRR